MQIPSTSQQEQSNYSHWYLTNKGEVVLWYEPVLENLSISFKGNWLESKEGKDKLKQWEDWEHLHSQHHDNGQVTFI